VPSKEILTTTVYPILSFSTKKSVIYSYLIIWKTYLWRSCMTFASNLIEEVLTSPFFFLLWNSFRLGTLEFRYTSRISCFNNCPGEVCRGIIQRQTPLEKSKYLWNITKEKIYNSSSEDHDILPKCFSVDLTTTWAILSTGIFSNWKQSSAIIICLGLRWPPKADWRRTCPTRRRILGSLANQPAGVVSEVDQNLVLMRQPESIKRNLINTK
jgi:hypothetical protein